MNRAKSGMKRSVLVTIAHFFSTYLALTRCSQFEAGAVRVVSLHVPAVVLNHSAQQVLLECNFVLAGDNHATNSASLATTLPSSASVNTSQAPTAGLVVKWFHSSGAEPVHQWIAGSQESAPVFGLLRGRARVPHVTRGTRRTRLLLVRPTCELSGEYTCRVSTWRGVDSLTRHMLVYAPPREMQLTSARTQDGHHNVTCHVTKVFPEPRLQLLVQSADTHRAATSSSSVEQKRWYDGGYIGSISQVFAVTSSPASSTYAPPSDPVSTTVQCVLSLPGTSHVQRKSIKLEHIRDTQISGQLSHHLDVFTSCICFMCLDYAYFSFKLSSLIFT